MIKLYSAKITDFNQADYIKQYSLLECAIRDKIDAKKSVESRQRSLLGYILLYRAIKELYLKSQLKIAFNEHGKPISDLCFFNISHSKDRVVCVVGDEPVGVDIQQIKPVSWRKKYRFFNEQENNYVNQREDMVSERYTEIFVKKEAAIKMLGLSLSQAITIDTFSKDFCFEIDKKDDFYICICRKNA